MIGWLKRKIDLASAGAVRTDLQRFVDFLRGADPDEIAAILVATAVSHRHLTNLADTREKSHEGFLKIVTALELGRLTDWNIESPMTMASLLRRVQNAPNQNLSVRLFSSGFMVLLHSLRCYSTPEVRFLGREMWSELRRGLPHVRQAIENFGLQDADSLAQACSWVPQGLGPVVSDKTRDEVKSPAMIAISETPSTTKAQKEPGFDETTSRVLTSRGIALEGPAHKDERFRKVITLSAWIGEQASLAADGRPTEHNEDDRFVAMLIAFVASDHLSRLAEVSFEMSSVLACMSLNKTLGGSFDPTAISELVATHNGMASDANQARILQAIGMHVAAFFATNSDNDLEKLRKLFSILRTGLHR